MTVSVVDALFDPARTPAMRVPAHVGRADIEAALDAAGWPWSRELSLLIDLCLAREEVVRERPA